MALRPVVIAASSSAMRIFACFIVSRRVTGRGAGASCPGEHQGKFVIRLDPGDTGGAEWLRDLRWHRDGTAGLQSYDERIGLARQFTFDVPSRLALSADDRVE